MITSIGLDIGGTKIAGTVFDDAGRDIAQASLPTPGEYQAFLATCADIVRKLEQPCGTATIGVCAPYSDETTCANVPCLVGKNLRADLEALFERPVALGNDANCAALAEAMDGAGKGYKSVFGLIMGTGVGAGFVLDGQVVVGANGLCGEIGHVPLPCYEPSDGNPGTCGCGKTGCIEYFISGGGLSRLYKTETGKDSTGKQICALAMSGDKEALRTLDRFYTLVAKAMVAVLHTFDPDIIVVSGGLNALPGLYDEVPKRWGKYAICKSPVTKFAPAAFGAVAGLRGAAWLGKSNAT